jgi:hypothetical protein
MQSLRQLFFLALIATLFSGCAASVQSPALGAIYTDAKAPITATSNELGDKVGQAEVTSVLGLVATGDASIQKAAENGNITKISHVDYHSENILGIFATYTVTVYGK